jgi:hypothetical protein
MLSLHERLVEASIEQERRSGINDQIDDVADRHIDQLVYELYGLSDKEVSIVEEATSSRETSEHTFTEKVSDVWLHPRNQSRIFRWDVQVRGSSTHLSRPTPSHRHSRMALC